MVVLDINLVLRPHQHQAGTEPPCLVHQRSGLDAEGLGGVAGRNCASCLRCIDLACASRPSRTALSLEVIGSSMCWSRVLNSAARYRPPVSAPVGWRQDMITAIVRFPLPTG